MLEVTRNLETTDIIFKFTDMGFANKTVVYSMELIATRLADEFMQKYGDETLQAIDKDELMKAITAQVAERVSVDLTVKNKEKK